MSEKTIFMKREQWEKWDKALRSGEYKQGKGVLYNEETGGYCCLGVLQKELSGDVERYGCGQPGALPSMKWLDDNGIRFIYLDGAHGAEYPYLPLLKMSATCANDNGVSFVTIANAIKQAVEFTD